MRLLQRLQRIEVVIVDHGPTVIASADVFEGLHCEHSGELRAGIPGEA